MARRKTRKDGRERKTERKGSDREFYTLHPIWSQGPVHKDFSHVCERVCVHLCCICGRCLVTKLRPTLLQPLLNSPSGSSVHGISQGRILELWNVKPKRLHFRIAPPFWVKPPPDERKRNVKRKKLNEPIRGGQERPSPLTLTHQSAANKMPLVEELTNPLQLPCPLPLLHSMN